MTRLQRGILYALALELTLVLIIYTGVACAASLYTAAHQAKGRQVTNPHGFTAIVGYPDQCVQGVPCWTYTKATRSRNPRYPERWYLHVGGVRVRDAVFGFYVMNPLRQGWRSHVARVCRQRCFLDGLGTTSLMRDKPRLRWTETKWVSAVAGLVRTVTASGKQVLPNSLSANPALSQPITDAAGRGSTEMFTPETARAVLSSGRIWVQERGDCSAKYTAYRWYKGRGDHFACYEWGTLPWDTSWLGLTNGRAG